MAFVPGSGGLAKAWKQRTRELSTVEKEQLQTGGFVSKNLWGRVSHVLPEGTVAQMKLWEPVFHKKKYTGPGGWQFPQITLGPQLRPKKTKSLGPLAPSMLGVKVGADFETSGLSRSSRDLTKATAGETLTMAEPEELKASAFQEQTPGPIFRTPEKPTGLALGSLRQRRKRLGSALV